MSGNSAGMTGIVYAPTAQLVESGNAQLNAAVIVDTMSASGNSIANTVTPDAPGGTVAYTPAQIRAAYGINALGAVSRPRPTAPARPSRSSMRTTTQAFTRP